jgi:branched-chain amino acid transport system ATP-binding protein
MTAVLEIKRLDKRFGGIHVTRNVNFSLAKGDRLALIGPNGAGKTTLVNQISGVFGPDAGEIWLKGANVTKSSQAQRVRGGLARTFQITTLAPHFPVRRQVEMALFEREGLTGRFWKAIGQYPVLNAEAESILSRFGLQDHAETATEDLAYGEQRLIEMALALALKPEVLLLDEPMAGVPKSDGKRLLSALNDLPKDLAILIIEHDMDLVFRFASRIVVLAEGSVIADSAPEDIRKDPQVRAAYLGN